MFSASFFMGIPFATLYVAHEAARRKELVVYHRPVG
jgi:hypothetical protein